MPGIWHSVCVVAWSQLTMGVPLALTKKMSTSLRVPVPPLALKNG